jgi:hypothetical protein
MGKDACLGTEKDFMDSIGSGVLSKTSGLLKECPEEKRKVDVFARLCTDKIRDRIGVPACRQAGRGTI